MRILAVLLVLSPFICLQTNAQNFRVKIYTPKLGIPQDSICDVYQDSTGVVWFAGAHGLYAFNGKFSRRVDSGFYHLVKRVSGGAIIALRDDKILRVRHSISSDTMGFRPKLEGAKILDASVDATGTYILRTTQGLLSLHRGQLNKVVFPGSTVHTDQFTLCNQMPGVHLFTSQAIYQWDPAALTFRIKTRLPRGTGQIKYCIANPEDQKTLLVLRANGVSESRELKSLVKPNWRALPDSIHIQDVHYFKKYILVSSLEGLWIGKKSTMGGYSFSLVMDGSEPHRTLKLPFHKVYRTVISYDDNLWLITELGLVLMQQTPFSRISPDIPMASFGQTAMGSDGTVYLQSNNGIFECRKNDVGDYVGGVSTLAGQVVTPCIAGRDDRIWVASRTYDLFYYQDRQYHKITNLGYRGHTVYYMYPDRNRNLWVFQAPGRDPITGVLRVTPDNKVLEYGEDKGFQSRMLSMYEAPDGTIYTCGIGDNSYLYRYDSATDRFVNLSVPLDFDIGNAFETHDLVVTKDTTIWLCSTAGLLRYHHGQVMKMDIEELYGNEAVAAAITADGKLWVSSNRQGMFRFDGDDYVAFDQYSGLASTNLWYRALQAHENNTVWVASEEGYYISSPDFVVRKTSKPVLTSINRVPVTSSSRHAFPYHSRMAFDFVSMTYPEQSVEYKYKLAGLNNDRWTMLNQFDTLVLTNLSNGNYELLIMARQRGGYHWSDPLVYHFTVDQVWYAQMPMIFAYVALGLTTVFGSVYFYSTRLIREKRILEQKVAQRTIEITKKNEEITEKMEEVIRLSDELATQRDNIESQNIALEKAKTELEQKVNERTSELSQANTELSDQNIQLEQFAFMTAHNLRAPIARLIGLTHIFNYQDATDAINSAVVKRVHDSVHELDEVVHDINSILQVKKGINANFSQINLHDCVQKVLRSFNGEIQSRGITINGAVATDILIEGIEPYVFSVLHNVISNSIKYSRHEGNSIITLMTDNQVDHVVLTCNDNGTGFDMGLQPDRLFKPFSRFHTDREGKGLGLYMIKIQMESMKGSVSIKSALNVGTSVNLVFAKMA